MGQKKIFRTWPENTAQILLNGQTLRSLGRSPAVDFWKARELKVDKTRNHCHVVLRTDAPEKPQLDGLTKFWVMGAQKHDGLAPAQMSVNPKLAKRLCEMIVSEGHILIGHMKDAGIVEENQINVHVLHTMFKTYAVVMQGHLPNTSWPRHKRKVGEQVDSVLCTCLEFLMHADCEHVIFVKALQGTIILDTVPERLPRGRKRKNHMGPERQPQGRKRKKATKAASAATKTTRRR